MNDTARLAEAGQSEQPAESETPRGALLAAGLSTGLLLCMVLLLGAPSLQHWMMAPLAFEEPDPVEGFDAAGAKRRISRLERRLEALTPRGASIIISSTDNTFRLMRGGTAMREGLCSTGSYVRLKGHEGKEWLFETPRGVFRVLDKRTQPVWVKPDWAFVETGEPIPPPGSAKRFERGVLGDYALSLGSGYLIHGTLYQRLLGTPVTHGCVRLGDEDLEAVYRALPVGARVYIY